METTMFETEGITKSKRFLGTPGEFALKHFIYVQETGCLQSIQSHRCVREKLESFLIFLVTRGSGVIQIEGTEYPLVMGDCVFIDCYGHYEHQSSGNDPWELMWVHCNGQHMKEFHQLFIEKNVGKAYITMENADRMKKYLNRLLKIQERQESMLEFHSSILIQQMIELLVEEAMHQEKDRSSVIYNQIREYINENYQKQALVQKMSEMFKMDVEEMDQGFQRIYGIDIYDYILNRRFTKAKEFLRFTIKPVSDIVEISGIRNEDLFRKMFKEHEKMTAEEYRKKWAQWVK